MERHTFRGVRCLRISRLLQRVARRFWMRIRFLELWQPNLNLWRRRNLNQVNYYVYILHRHDIDYPFRYLSSCYPNILRNLSNQKYKLVMKTMIISIDHTDSLLMFFILKSEMSSKQIKSNNFTSYFVQFASAMSSMIFWNGLRKKRKFSMFISSKKLRRIQFFRMNAIFTTWNKVAKKLLFNKLLK